MKQFHFRKAVSPGVVIECDVRAADRAEAVTRLSGSLSWLQSGGPGNLPMDRLVAERCPPCPWLRCITLSVGPNLFTEADITEEHDVR